VQWLLNFDYTEGPIDTHWAKGTAYPGVPTDGDDRIFGDLGNDWAVGGTGRDQLWGGWGDDLLNLDDKLTSNGGLNNVTDTNPSYEDMAYGGAGRDVLISNTNGDRLIDWVGEFNTFLTPYAQFGQGSVSRDIQPQIQDYLYALSKSDGADQTLAAQHGGDPSRNGEPFGELGLVLPGDTAWHDQTGGPRDPQAGNLPGGQADVLRSAGNLPISMTAGGPDGSGSVAVISVADLSAIVAEAKLNWADALGADDPRLGMFQDLKVTVADLSQGQLGETLGHHILIDDNGAGRGWFVDLTPSTNTEFSINGPMHDELSATSTSAAFGRMDLLTVVMHEMGHALGFDHDQAGTYAVMHEQLDPGIRYILDHFQGDPAASSGASAIVQAALLENHWMPTFDNKPLDTSGPGLGKLLEEFDWSGLDNALSGGNRGSIDWNSRTFGKLWSPFSTSGGAGTSGIAPNIPDFLHSLLESGGTGKDNGVAGLTPNQAQSYDQTGAELLKGSAWGGKTSEGKEGKSSFGQASRHS